MSQYLPVELKERANLLVGERKYMNRVKGVVEPLEAWTTKRYTTGSAITDSQWQILDTYFADNAAGPVQSSIICKGEECPYVESCPLARAKVQLPMGDPCVVEETVKRNWAALYFREIGVAEDGYAAVDRGVVIDLMNTMLDIKRAQDEVAKMPNVAERVLRGFDKDNNAIIEMKMNPVHFYLKNARLLKQKLLQNLVATREARAKDKSRQTESTAQLMVQMREAVESLAATNQDLIDKEPTIIDAEFDDPDDIDPQV